MTEISRTLLLICLIFAWINPRANDFLESLVKGTPVTPALSGLQVSLMRKGSLWKEFALGDALVTPRQERALRTDHKVRVASISKLLVAIGVLQLVEARQLDLDQEAAKFLGWRLRNPNFPNLPITIRSLLSHTSSVRDGTGYFIPAGAGRLREFFSPESDLWGQGSHWASDVKEKPGQYFYYANLNFGLLAELIEKTSGQRFDRYMTEKVLAPLNITARFNPCAIAANQLAAGYRKRDSAGVWSPLGPWLSQVDANSPDCFYGMKNLNDPQIFLDKYKLGSNASLFSPQGGLRASASDLVAILSMLARGGELGGRKILSSLSVDAMLSSEWSLNRRGDNGRSSGESKPNGPRDGLMSDYGLSVHRIDLGSWGFKNGPSLMLGHLGNAYGVLSFALLDPDSGNGIAAIITGVSDDPSKFPGHSPLYRVQEKLLGWWLDFHIDDPSAASNSL